MGSTRVMNSWDRTALGCDMTYLLPGVQRNADYIVCENPQKM